MGTCNFWEKVDELAFYENGIFLEACARSQVEDFGSRTNIPESNHQSLPWARDFLDDFALVASGPGEASNVAAACLEISQSGGEFLTIRVAKNENFGPEARLKLSRIVQIMNRVRERDLPVSEGQDLCFDIIVTGCRSRILKQIRGEKGLGSLVSQLPMSPVECNSIHGISGKVLDAASTGVKSVSEHNSCRDEDTPQLAASRWAEMKELVNISQGTSDLEALKRLARLAYDVRRSNCLRVLLNAHCRQHHRSKQIIEKLGKIAKFCRSAVCIIHVAASAAVRSMQIKVEPVPSLARSIEVLRDHTVEKMRGRIPSMESRSSSQVAEIERFLRRWRKYVVHAEMLLLTFYEEHPEINVAINYIGISKRSCYLCANFIRTHGRFAVEGQHQQLYCLWTLPQEIKFGSQDRSTNFARALRDLQLLLAKRVDEVSRPWYRSVGFHKESVANFSRLTIISGGRSTELLNTITENEECVSPIVACAPLDENETNAATSLVRKSSEKPQDHSRKTSTEMVQEVAKQDIETNGSSSVTTSVMEDLSNADPPDLQAPRTPPTVSKIVGVPLSQDARNKISREGRLRHHTHRGASDKYVARRGARKKTKRPATRPHAHRRARREKEEYVRPGPVPSRGPVSRKRQSKRTPRERHKRDTVGCISILLSCLTSARDFLVATFQNKTY